jgi:hypothetical protein
MVRPQMPALTDRGLHRQDETAGEHSTVPLFYSQLCHTPAALSATTRCATFLLKNVWAPAIPLALRTQAR